MNSGLCSLNWVVTCVLAALMVGPVAAQDYVDRYAMAPNSVDLDMGLQPLSYPNGVIGAVMRRDRILRAALLTLGTPLKVHAFKRGADMLPLISERKLDAGLIGDMPTTIPASQGQVWIVGLAEVSQNAVVAQGGARVEDLAGKRIGYVPVSTAHATLMRALASARLGAHEVKLVAMGNADLPDALARREIDAFVGWEPVISMALAANPKNRIIFRSESVDYFVIRRDFEQASPEAARVLVAGFVRAIEWMRRSPQNAQKAAKWVLADGGEFLGSPVSVPVSQVVAVTRSGILNIPSAPVIVKSAGAEPLKAEFELLKSLDKLPGDGRWDHVAASFGYEGMGQVMANPRQYALRRFDFEE
jgi:sulfonate transport system substrate-binding protein